MCCPLQAARGLFGALRWAEAVPGAKRVLIADVEHIAASRLTASLPVVTATVATAAASGGAGASTAALSVEHAASVGDRAFRAASGRVLVLTVGQAPPLRPWHF